MGCFNCYKSLCRAICVYSRNIVQNYTYLDPFRLQYTDNIKRENGGYFYGDATFKRGGKARFKKN